VLDLSTLCRIGNLSRRTLARSRLLISCTRLAVSRFCATCSRRCLINPNFRYGSMCGIAATCVPF